MNAKVQIVTYLLIYVVVKASPLLLHRWKITIIIKDHHPITSRKASATIAAVVLNAILIIGELNNTSCYSIHCHWPICTSSVFYFFNIFKPLFLILFIFSFSIPHFSFLQTVHSRNFMSTQKNIFSCCCSHFFVRFCFTSLYSVRFR